MKEMGSKHAMHMKSPSRKRKNKTKKPRLIRVTFADSGGHSMFHTPAHTCTTIADKEKPLSVPPYLCLRETSGELQ